MLHRIFCIFCILFLTCSCISVQNRKKFDTAQELISNDKPDSALAVLAGVDTSRLYSRESKARYSLLHTIALYKGFHDEEITLNDIVPAVKWYSRHGSADERMKACYYQGVIYNLNGDIQNAACSFMDAEVYETRVEDKHDFALMLLTFGELYNKTYNTQLEISYIRRALRILEATGDPLYTRALGDLAMAYHNAREWNLADSLYRVSIDANAQVNPRAAKEYMQNYAAMKVLIPEKDPAGAINLLDRLRRDFAYALTPYDAALYAYSLVLEGRKEDAQPYLSSLERIDIKDDCRTSSLLFRLYNSENDNEQALRFLKQTVNSQSRDFETALSDSVSKALKDHFQRKEEEKSRKIKLLIELMSSLTAIAIAVLTILSYRNHARRMEIEKLLSILDDADDEKSKKNLIAEKSMSLARDGDIADLIWQNQNNRLSDKEFLSRLEARFGGVKSYYSNLEKLEKSLDERLPGVVSHLKADLDIPDGSEDLRFLCYILMHLRPDMISELMGIKVNSVYVKKSRLKKQILSIDNEHKQEYRILFGENR